MHSKECKLTGQATQNRTKLRIKAKQYITRREDSSMQCWLRFKVVGCSYLVAGLVCRLGLAQHASNHKYQELTTM